MIYAVSPAQAPSMSYSSAHIGGCPHERAFPGKLEAACLDSDESTGAMGMWAKKRIKEVLKNAMG